MVRDRLRRLIRGAARRVVGGGPRIPNAGRTERTPPTTRSEWQPEADDALGDGPEEEPELELSAAAVLERIADGEAVVLVDVREAHELWSGHARGAILAPMSRFQELASGLPDGPLLAIYCAAGARSYGIADYLRKNGRPRAWSIPEGFGGWIDAGGAWLQPATDTDWKLLQAAALTPEAAAARDCPDGADGWIQSIERVDGTLSVTLRSREGTTWRALTDDELAAGSGGR